MTNLDHRFATASLWQPEAVALRQILLDCDLAEARKWGKPCYSHNDANIAIIQRMNDFLALMFFQGALLDDPTGALEEQGKNTRSARRLCLRSVSEVEAAEPVIRALVKSAIEAREEGRELPERPALVLADELQERLDADPELQAAFEALTPGRQRGYNLHISGAKQSATRARRVEKHVDRILAGKGLQDR